MVGTVLGQDDAEQVLDLAGADAHGEGGHRHAPPGGLVERGDRSRDGGFDRRPCGSRRLQPLLDLAGVVVDGLSAAPGLLGLAGDRPVASGEDSGGVADPGAQR